MVDAFDISNEIPGWIFRMLVVIALSFGVLFIVVSSQSVIIDSTDLEIDLATKKLYFSKDCFAYEDERVYIGEIDEEKFTEERLLNCWRREDYVVKVWFEGEDALYSDKKLFDRLEDFCKFEKYHCTDEKVSVLVQGKLKILNTKVIKNV